jgi:hypothetical protein
MNILLYQDDTLGLNLDAIAFGLNAAGSPGLNVRKGNAEFHIAQRPINHPTSYKRLSPALLAEAKSAELSFCFTSIPYDNNYFFEANDNLVIVSFYEWERLTNLPVENGVVYFVASLLSFELPVTSAHDDVTGCINDFLWDKTGVDLGMRTGVMCPACKGHLNTEKLKPGTIKLLKGIERILHDLGAASRNDENVVDYWRPVEAPSISSSISPKSDRLPDKFDVFLCHNVKDKVEVRRIGQELEARDIRTWLDEEQLRPGMAWQVVMEEQIGLIQSVAVFVGSSGIGPWQSLELYAFLSEFADRRCPVIPVILPDAKTVPELPRFLRQMQFVDFRENPNDAMERLIWGITGKKPQRSSIK